MKYFVTVLLLFSTLILNAQFHKAKLLLTNGSIKEGFAKLPSNKLLENKIKFRFFKKGAVEKIKDNEVSKIMITSKNGNTFLFERLNVVHLFKSFGRKIELEKKNKQWMLLYYTNKKLNCYSLAQRYKIDKKGIMHSITGSNSIWEFVYFLLKRNAEEKSYIVNAIGFTHGEVRKAMSIYFKDIPEFVERINNKEFKKTSVRYVADEYAKYFN